MDLVLTPLRLELSAFVDLYLPFLDKIKLINIPTTIRVFEKILWHYKVTEIVKNIFDKKKKTKIHRLLI